MYSHTLGLSTNCLSQFDLFNQVRFWLAVNYHIYKDVILTTYLFSLLSEGCLEPPKSGLPVHHYSNDHVTKAGVSKHHHNYQVRVLGRNELSHLYIKKRSV
uniref:Uncharacterized protein n=1 Tax=Cacopsylla melanoneura TaxID=428564 RepID=A0A8D8M6K3_9HEMI